MFNRVLKRLKMNQSGFTLIELMVSLAIISMITLGATLANAQIINQTSRNEDFTTASRQALNAVHWISRDAQMSHDITGWEGFPLTEDLTISWTEWDNSECVAVYSVQDNNLSRSYTVDGGSAQVTLIATNINDDEALTDCVYADGTLTVKITSTVGENDRAVSFTKEANISSRPNI